MSDPSPTYNLCVYCGPHAPALEGVRVLDVTPASYAPADVEAALRASALAPSDFRARAVFVSDAPRDLVLATYAALCGLAARRLDAVVHGAAVAAAGPSPADAALERPATTPDTIVTGLAGRANLPFVALSSTTPGALAALRHAPRVLLTPDPEPAAALRQLLLVAALRRRGEHERLPMLVVDDDPTRPIDPEALVDLEELRRVGAAVRRALSEEFGPLVEAAEASERVARLRAAAATPMDVVLTRLGAAPSDTAPEPGSLWHCPRPERHSHGDARPSLHVTPAGQTRCFRCDPEPVDALTLVADALGLTADEAADWIDSGVARPHRHLSEEA